MEKYLGNKSKIILSIYDAINKYRGSEDQTFFDPFSGTTNVSKFFKNKGLRVICNDINDMSFVLGKCYIETNTIPNFLNLNENTIYFNKLKNIKNSSEYSIIVNKYLNQNRNTTDNMFLAKIKNTNYLDVLIYLTYFADEHDCSENYLSTNFIEDNYCENGRNSRYINLVYKKSIDNILKLYTKKNSLIYERIMKFYDYPFDDQYLIELADIFHEKQDYNSETKIKNLLKKNLTGNRMFFSQNHAKRMDIILNTINYWRQEKFINLNEFYILLTALLETIAIFSNTSATYQAFYKDYKANTKQEFRLIIPEINENTLSGEVYQEDAYDLMHTMKTDILYLDPPYNWRQYDSNYHLLNTIARYHTIKDIKQFEKNIIGASGENRVEKLKYTNFNNKNKFEDLLLQQILHSKCKIVALSYSDSSSNHKREDIDKTIIKIKCFFSDKNLFKYSEMFEINSTNFESRKGNKKNRINELLFLGIKNN